MPKSGRRRETDVAQRHRSRSNHHGETHPFASDCDLAILRKNSSRFERPLKASISPMVNAVRRSSSSPAEKDLRYFEDFILPPKPLGPRLPNLRFLLIGTCQIEHLIASAGRYGYQVEHILYASDRQNELPEISLGRHDAAVVSLTLRAILNQAAGQAYDVFYLKDYWTAELAADTLEKCTRIIQNCVDNIQSKLGGMPAFYMSFLEPSLNYEGNLTPSFGASQIGPFIRRLNEALAQIVTQAPDAYFLDVNEAFNFVGRMHLHDDLVSHTTHASIIGGFDDDHDADRLVTPTSNLQIYDVGNKSKLLHSYLYNRLSDNLKIIRQIDVVKIIIIDLDDTLWRGVAADSEMEDWIRIEGWPLGFLEALLYYKRRGGLLAICSKNDHEPTVDCLRRLCGDRLELRDFVSVKINWKSKAENIAEILSETNLLPDSALFIDDNPREVDEVSARFPTLRCLGGNPHDWRRVILCSPETQVARISAESQDRTRLVRARIERELSSTSMSRDEWLRSLGIEQAFYIVRSMRDNRAARALELINKTNQFNTDGRRWSSGELGALFQGGGFCLVTTLRDKTTDNGVVGVAILRPGEIIQTVLSCRVFGLGAELALGSVATALVLRTSPQARASIADTNKNLSCHDYYDRLGYSKRDNAYLGDRAPDIPDWIQAALPDELALGLRRSITASLQGKGDARQSRLGSKDDIPPLTALEGWRRSLTQAVRAIFR